MGLLLPRYGDGAVTAFPPRDGLSAYTPSRSLGRSGQLMEKIKSREQQQYTQKCCRMWLQQLHHFERFVGGWLKQPGHIPRDAGSHLGTLELVGEAHGQLLEFLGVSLVGPLESFGGFLERVFGSLGGSVGGSWGSLGVPAWSPLTCENVHFFLFLFSFERLEVLRGVMGLSGCSPNHSGILSRYLETM